MQKKGCQNSHSHSPAALDEFPGGGVLRVRRVRDGGADLEGDVLALLDHLLKLLGVLHVLAVRLQMDVQLVKNNKIQTDKSGHQEGAY